jgi:hypothetical protein
MDSVTATNGSGMADLIQLLSSSGSPLLSSGLSSSQIQSTLQNASPSDIVQLSDEALQLQVAESLFGSPDTSQTTSLFSDSSSSSSSTILANLLATLSAGSAATTSNASEDSSSSASSPSTSSVADQIASYQTQLQAEQMQTLFGTASTTGVSGTSLNVFA